MAPHKAPRFRPLLRTANPYRGHPSERRWSSDGYMTHFREAAVAAHFGGFSRNAMVTFLHNQRLWCHCSSIYCWRRRLQLLGHLRRFSRTGNRRATVLRGVQLISLAIWREAPNIWLHHANGRLRFYQPSQISKVEDSLGLSSKRALTTARQAMFPLNLQLRFNYWFLPCPFGIANVPRSRIIDLDKAALFVESGNCSRGKTHMTRRVREVGPYGHSEKLNILCAILGEDCVVDRPACR